MLESVEASSSDDIIELVELLSSDALSVASEVIDKIF